MLRSDGSAAVAAQVTPESANIESRSRLLAELPAQLDRMEHAIRLARLALAGPDPEAAVAYLELLGDRVSSALSVSR